MKKLLLILFLIWGCDYAPTEHTHDTEHISHHEHFICIHRAANYITIAGHFDPAGNIVSDTLYWLPIEPESSDSLAGIHASNINQAESECLEMRSSHFISLGLDMDSLWCECEAGIKW